MLTPSDAFNNKIKRRQFGDSKGMLEGCLVCHTCLAYVCPQTASAPLWRDAWPAVIWTCLSKQGYANPQTFMSFLPHDLRAAWLHSKHEWTQDMIDAQWIEPDFQDKTSALELFRMNIASGKLQLLMESLNATAYPDVRCPLGCYLYFDEDNTKIKYLPASHFLAKIIPNFSSFKANEGYFQYARADWTSPVYDLDWVVRPTLIVDSDEGLCILMCSSKLHHDGRTAFVHVPQHPLYHSTPPVTCDILAPVVVSATVVKGGNSNVYNTSYPVLKQEGNNGGLSTMRLSTTTTAHQMNELDAMANGLTLHERPDILEYAAQSECFESQTISDTLKVYMQNKLPVNVIQRCAQASTFVDEYDAHLATSTFNSQCASTEEQPYMNLPKMDSKHCVLIVHPCTAEGHLPFPLPRGKSSRANPNLPMSSLLYSIMHSFIHVRVLHSMLLHQIWRSRDLPLHNDVYDIVQKYMSLTAPALPVTNDKLRRLSTTFDALHPTFQAEDKIAHVLLHLCPDIVYTDIHSMHFPEVISNCSPTIYMVNARGHHPPMAPMPHNSPDSKWLLLYCICANILEDNADIHISFRWSPKFEWQHCGNAEDIPTDKGLFFYVSVMEVASAKDYVMQRSGGQTGVHCLIHDNFLIREQVGSATLCCVPYCTTAVRWRCSYAIATSQCDTGLCFKHMREAKSSCQDVRQAVAPFGPHPIQRLHQHADNSHHIDSDGDSNSSEASLILQSLPTDDVLTGLPADQFDSMQIPGFASMDAFCPPFTNPAVSPAYLSERSSKGTLGHYLLNNHLQLLRRSNHSQKPPVHAQRLLQTICSRTPQWIVPLLYPEAQLFPRIFWNIQAGSFVGALPAVMFTELGQRSKTLDIAPLKDHLLVRLMDGSIMTSHDISYMQFNFDVLLNTVLNGNSAVIACKRGLEHLTRQHNTQRLADKESILQLDELDARREVKRLSAILRSEGAWHYFVTLTCNDSATMGVWPIRAAIIRNFPTSHEVVLQNYAVILCRAWERTVRYIWNYIQFSPEQPLGHVKTAWMRFEFQSAGALGNKPHVHGGITLHPESEDVTLSRICCCMKDFFTASAQTDLKRLIETGITPQLEDFIRLYSLASQLQTHSCQNAGSRCLKRRAADDSLICRVPRHPPSLVPKFHEKEALYDTDTLQRLKYLDLGTLDPVSGQWIPYREFRGGFWQYPAQPGEHFVPTVPMLFVALQSSTNVQYCDRKFQVSYLAKYAAGIEKQDVTFKPDPFRENAVQVQVEPYMHTKITGQAIKASQKNRQNLAREIALTEMIWFCAGFPYVTCLTDSTNVSTMPPEYRTAVLKNKRRVIPVDGAGGHPLPVVARRDLADWRQFSPTQELAIQEYSDSSYCLDVMTAFSLRPPELLMFDNVELYAKWFCFATIGRRRYELDEDLSLSPWLDGASRQVRLRYSHVKCAAEYIYNLQFSDNSEVAFQAQLLYHSIIEQILSEHESMIDSSLLSPMYQRFVDSTKTRRNVVIFTQVTPTQFSRFLVHLMLSFGHFNTEIDLYSAPSLLQAFRMASLIGEGNPTHDDVKRIARNYVQDQLQWLAISTRHFSRLLQSLIEGLQRFLLEQDIVYDSLPTFLERDMVRQATEEVQKLELARRSVAVDALFIELADSVPNFPAVASLKEKLPVDFAPEVNPLPEQLQASVDEQSTTLAACVNAIDNLFQATTTFTKWPLLVGPPGSGKTHILLIAQTYAFARCLKTQLVAMTSERARRLGGEHIHLLFGLPVTRGHACTISVLAEQTLFRLKRTPIRLAALQRLDVLFIEEIGLISAETFAVLDVVLRHIRDNPVPMGGVLLIASGDPRQLTPISGSPIWSSYHLICSFSVHSLKHYVRAQRDSNLQTLLELLRKSSLTDEDIHCFEAILRRHCIPSNCVLSWNDVPGHVLRIVGTRQASKQILDQFLLSKQADPLLECFTFEAVDEIEQPGGQVLAANRWTTNQLNYKCLEPSTLVVYVGAVMRLTYNNTYPTATCPRFSQGQLCIVINITSKADFISSIITVKLVPPGIREFDVNHPPEEWPAFSVKKRSSPPVSLSGQKTHALRKQFPLTNFVCSTIHKAIGETLPKIATQVSLIHKEYRLWEREQLLVLLSRVATLQDIIFVTNDNNDAINAMMHLLQMPSRWAAHIDQVLQSLDSSALGPRAIRHQLDLQPTGCEIIPTSDIGFVYVLVSTTDPKFAYVGETSSIRRRLREHNTGHGSRFTQNPALRPWALLALVSGFPGVPSSEANVHARKNFEHEYHLLNGQLHNVDVRAILANGRLLYGQARVSNQHLVWQEFLHVSVHSMQPNQFATLVPSS